jgi:F-type H+-transporting ATPase subunit 8
MALWRRDRARKQLLELRIYKRKKIIILTNNMPQLIPFYFLNQLVFAILTLIVLIYVLSKYVLPLYTYKNVVRLYLTKLTNKS